MTGLLDMLAHSWQYVTVSSLVIVLGSIIVAEVDYLRLPASQMVV